MKRAETMIVHRETLSEEDWREQHQMIIVIRGEQLGVKFDLLQGLENFTIGRSADANITVQDETASWSHCQLVCYDSRWYLEDLNSTNGTYIDTRRVIGRKPLVSGDCFKVGKSIFKFVSTSQVEASYYEEIYRLAVCDGLTQLPNRRLFEESLDREFARAQRHKRPLSLIMFDVDKFKLINDNYGHLCGDMALRAIADTFRPRMRREDLFARYAGDEFVWILSETVLPQALLFAEWLVNTCRKIKITFKKEPVYISLSVGVASFNTSLKSAKELIDAADQALYRAKEGGRDQASK
jgi:two-component system, cell cycle response regulator